MKTLMMEIDCEDNNCGCCSLCITEGDFYRCQLFNMILVSHQGIQRLKICKDLEQFSWINLPELPSENGNYKVKSQDRMGNFFVVPAYYDGVRFFIMSDIHYYNDVVGWRKNKVV